MGRSNLRQGSTVRLACTLLALTLAVGACGESPGVVTARNPIPTPPELASRSELVRPLVAIVRLEPNSVSTRGLQRQVSFHLGRRMFNAQLALIDDRGNARPELAESLPQLNTDSWRVYPDGGMETTYGLRSGLVWHDAASLTADDFVFAWRVYTRPEFGHAGFPPFHAVDSIEARDGRTVVVRWKLLYADAASLSARDRDLPPLPRQVLQESFNQQSPEAFINHPFWTRHYVGLGPYRLDRWEPGAFLEGRAFESYVLGRPKIERLRVMFMSDSNTALARILAGEAHMAADDGTGQRVEALKQEWVPSGTGVVLRWPNAWRAAFFQMRPAVQNPRALGDARVRKALAYAADREAINAAVYSGDLMLADSMIWSGSEFGPAAERAASYPYDPQRSAQLMAEAGFTRGPDGFFSGPDGRFTAEVKTNSGADNEPEMLALASFWKQAGFDVQEAVLPAAQAQDNQVRSLFPAIYTNNINMGDPTLTGMTTGGITRPENLWQGINRGGWSHESYDRLVDTFNRTLERGQRIELAGQLVQIYAEELPAVPLFFRSQAMAHVASLRGPGPAVPESSMMWNMHEWGFGSN